MPGSGIAFSVCGAPTTAWTLPLIAALIAVAAESRAARPCAASIWPSFSSPGLSCWRSSRQTERSSHSAASMRSKARMRGLRPHARACSSSTPRSPTRSGWHTASTRGSSAAFSATSGPIPAGSPVAMAMRGRVILVRSDLERFQRLGREELFGLEAPLGQALLVVIAQERVEHVPVLGEAIRQPVFAEDPLGLFDVCSEPRQHRLERRGLREIVIGELLRLAQRLLHPPRHPPLALLHVPPA